MQSTDMTSLSLGQNNSISWDKYEPLNQFKTEINVKMKTTRYRGAFLDLISGTMCIAEK